MKLIKPIGQLLIFIILTTFTQIGGIIWLLAYFISKNYKIRKLIVFPILYLVFNILIIPPLARVLGREKLPVFNSILKPQTIVYPLLFRNYVKPELYYLLTQAASRLDNSGIKITYLDANFPFYDGFPLFPHLSHNDGKKIDISFMYLNSEGLKTDKKPSITGYGVYVKKENPTTKECLNKGFWQYDFTKHVALLKINDLKLDTENTKLLIEELLINPNSHKIFIEPYLKEELGLNNYSKIRFHGCQAVRHDDHIHFQIK